MKGFFNKKFSSTSVHTFYNMLIKIYFVILGQNYRSSRPELFENCSKIFLKIHLENNQSGVLLYKFAGF